MLAHCNVGPTSIHHGSIVFASTLDHAHPLRPRDGSEQMCHVIPWLRHRRHVINYYGMWQSYFIQTENYLQAGRLQKLQSKYAKHVL